MPAHRLGLDQRQPAHEPRDLEHRPEGAVWVVAIAPGLVAVWAAHLAVTAARPADGCPRWPAEGEPLAPELPLKAMG